MEEKEDEEKETEEEKNKGKRITYYTRKDRMTYLYLGKKMIT